MTKEEAQILYEQSHNHTLRKPNCICADTKMLDSLLKSSIGLIFYRNADELSPLERSFRFVNCKQSLKKHPYVKKLKGRGTADKPYKLSTIFGEGEFLDLHSIYKNGNIPDFIKKFYCFSNCMTYSMLLAKKEIDSTVLTGIAHYKTPFLHAVLLGWHDDRPQIFDFNYDLVMDQDLYMKLFSFEVLSKLDGQSLWENKDIIQNGPKLKDFQILLAFDDCIKFKSEALLNQPKSPQENAKNYLHLKEK